MKFATKAIHVGEEPALAREGDVVVPIHLSTTFARREVEKPKGGYEYSRTANPTRDALELRLAALEESRYALAFASGLAAEASLVLSLLKKGDHVVAFDDLYGGTRRLFSQILSNFGLDFTYVDAREVRNVDRAVGERTKMIWLESPTNPLLKICDIKAISEVASRHHAITVVDNTFMSPYFQNPLQLGADVVLHSATKYLGGHSDVLGGAIMTSNEEIYAKAKFNQNAIGAVPSPFDCFLLMRGLKTLALRMERHQLNATRVAQHLEGHSAVENVVYPGLKSHPQYALGKRQTSGFGGVVSFEVKGTLRDVKRFLRGVKVFSLAESLGGVESLIEHPASMTHASVPGKAREGLGITERLVRASVGIEDANDLIEDLDGALG